MNYRKALLNNNEEFDNQIYSKLNQSNKNTNQLKNKKRRNRNKNKEKNVEVQNNVKELNDGFIEVKSGKQIKIDRQNNKSVNNPSYKYVDKTDPEYIKWIKRGITHEEYCRYENKLQKIFCMCCCSDGISEIIKRPFSYNCPGCCCCDPSWYM